jgi:hypothetical protein
MHRLEALQERLQAKLSDALLPLAATNLTRSDAGLRMLQPFYTMRRIVCGTEFRDSHKTV